MKDPTQGSITHNILAMAAPLAAGMISQTLNLMVDRYFVAARGEGVRFMYWFLPGIALQFAMVGMGSACWSSSPSWYT